MAVVVKWRIAPCCLNNTRVQSVPYYRLGTLNKTSNPLLVDVVVMSQHYNPVSLTPCGVLVTFK